MPWLKLLHFAALLCWCGSLLYLPALIASGAQGSHPRLHPETDYPVRVVFTHFATPAALLAIGSGTLLFLLAGEWAGWLVVKLAAVAGMALCHALCGVLVLRLERQPERALAVECIGLGGGAALLVGVTLWLVLAKPQWGGA
ncbi:MAG TPA: CopD family protein [Pseudomonas sp.]|nr:CopD family protein [Pseudomonas sp.]